MYKCEKCNKVLKTTQSSPNHVFYSKIPCDREFKCIKCGKKFKQELEKELGDNKKEPRLEAAAKYIIFNEAELSESATDLSAAFREMEFCPGIQNYQSVHPGIP